MAAGLGDKLTRITDNDSGRPVIATLASSKSVGATSISVSDTTNWTTTTKIHFTIYNTVNTAGATVKDTSSQTDWIGTLSGTTISNVTITGGTDRTYNAGAVVELTPTSKWAKDLYDGLSVVHNSDGTLKSNVINATNLLADGVITSTKIATGSVTPDKINIPYKFSAGRNATLTTTAMSPNVIVFDVKAYDTNNNFSTTTGAYTAPVAGFYHFDATMSLYNSGGAVAYILIRKNGTEFRRGGRDVANSSSALYLSISVDLQLAANDTVDIALYTSNASSIEAGAAQNWFDGHFISAT